MKDKKQWLLLAALVAGIVLVQFATYHPEFVEKYFAKTFYPLIAGPVSSLTGLFPLSVAEAALVALAAAVLYWLVRGAMALVRQPRQTAGKLPRFVVPLAAGLAALYMVFMLMWGLNYSRLTFAELSGLTVHPSTARELAELARELVERANELRQQLEEDPGGVMQLSGGIPGMLARVDQGFSEAAVAYPQLAGSYGRPKPVVMSYLMSKAGITGIYIPFTGEAHFNAHMPHSFMPATVTHEMAHQRGFAREDEANYIAYLVCTLHPDPDFQYSGVLLALVHTMRALAEADSQQHGEIMEMYSPGLRRDLEHWRDYWQSFAGPVERATNRLNDSYLRANRQQEGVASYGYMVDLLLAERRQRR